MRAFILAVTGFGFIVVAACSSYGTSVVELEKQAQVASVSVALPSTSLIAGQTQRGRVTVMDANGVALSGRPVAWFTSSASVATVNDSGVVAAVTPGTATLSAVSEGVAGTAALTVIPRPPIPVAKVLVAVNPAAVLVGQTARATVALQDSSGNALTDRTVTWTSGSAGVATVSGNGDISAVAPGTAAITAASEGKTASASLSVSAPSPVPVATVSVSPGTASIQVGATVQLSATTLDANGAALSGRAIGWSSASPGVASVSSNGLVSAVSAGTVQISASSEGQTSSATITVTAIAPTPVATVSVSPTAASPVVGTTVQLSATTRDASGGTLNGRVVTWSSANAGIASVSSATGLVTAVAVGTVQVSATSEGRIGTATINVQAPAPPPPPPPPGSYNEPAGMTRISERPFNALDEVAGWDTDATLSIVQDPTAPFSPSNVLRCTFRAGFVAGSSNGHAGTQWGTPYRTLYVRYWTKYSDNWQGQQTFNKQWYAWVNGSYPPIFFGALGAGSNPLTPEPVLQRMIQGDGFYAPNLVPGARFTRGQWDLVEAVLVGNTAGTANGTMDWYLNGVHVGSVGGLQYASGAAFWNIFEFYPVWGGTGGANVSADMYIQWDHVYLSGK